MASGISAVIGTISLLGALIVLVGVGMAVVAASQGRSTRGGVILAVVGILIFGLFQIASRGVIVVQPTQIAVVFRTLSGELVEDPRQSGTHIIYPVFEEAILYPINIQEYTMSGTTNEGAQAGNDAVRARTLDGQEVSMDITVFYQVDLQLVNQLHRRWYETSTGRALYENEFVRPTVRGLVRDVASRFTARQIYGETRTEMRQAMLDAVRTRFAEEGLLLTDLILRDVTFSEQFTNAIEQAQVAEQEADRAEIRVREAGQEAEQVRVRAAGERDAAIARAEGEAQSIVLRAEAEAEALRLVSEQIAANPALIQYQYVQNLSDNINIALVPSGSPFLFDFNSFEDLPASRDITAPDAVTSEDSGN
jgi:regulator of protease activity HflC (stomatin/prohibitin superfamily)